MGNTYTGQTTGLKNNLTDSSRKILTGVRDYREVPPNPSKDLEFPNKED